MMNVDILLNWMVKDLFALRRGFKKILLENPTKNITLNRMCFWFMPDNSIPGESKIAIENAKKKLKELSNHYNIRIDSKFTEEMPKEYITIYGD